MIEYRSPSSFFVRMATFVAMLIAIFIVLTLFRSGDYGLIVGTVLSILILFTIAYLFSISLHKVIVTETAVILKRRIGKIKIEKSGIVNISELQFANLNLTYGSQGVFGFIGNTKDNSLSLVKDRRNMIKIISEGKTYIISTEKPSELVSKIASSI